MYYFKTKQKVLKVRSKESHREEWRYTGIISPLNSDYLVLSTKKFTEAIFHSDRELPLIKRRLTDKGYRWRLYKVGTDECLNVVQDINGQITELID